MGLGATALDNTLLYSQKKSIKRRYFLNRGSVAAWIRPLPECLSMPERIPAPGVLSKASALPPVDNRDTACPRQAIQSCLQGVINALKGEPR